MNPARIISAAPDVAVGGAFLLTWIAPSWLGPGLPNYALQLMLLEFIVIHSAAFMGAVAISDLSRAKKTTGVLGLGALYTTFLVAFALVFEEWWQVWGFWTLTLNRLSGVLIGTVGERRGMVQREWATSAALYLLWVLATVLFPLPRLGMTAAVAAETGMKGSGLWVDEPHRLIVAGAGYFLSQAYVELRDAA